MSAFSRRQISAAARRGASLENARNPNPTIDTLGRYAEALGKDIMIVLTDAS
jgi:hypothetical protein